MQLIQTNKYWCEDCKEVHNLEKVKPVHIFMTGFSYIKAFDASFNIGYCGNKQSGEE